MLTGLFAEPLAVGTQAPDFALADQEGNVVRLSDLRGKNVVLVFYPADDTPTCTKQLCEFRDSWAEAQARNTVVFGVNPASSEKHARFRSKYALPFPILVDAGQKVGALYRAKFLVPRRTVYLIGPDGRVRYARRGKPEPAEVFSAAV